MLRSFLSVTALLSMSVGANAQAPLTGRTFPSGERISLSFEPAGVGGTGTVTRHVKGEPSKSVTIDYMVEFAAIVSPNRIAYNVMGLTDKGQIMWSCEATIDWSRGAIVRTRDLSPKIDHPRCD